MRFLLALPVLAVLPACGTDASPQATPAEGPGEASAGASPAPEPEQEPADPRLDEAIRRIAAGDHAGALALAEAVRAERPGSARAAFASALAYHKQKNYGAALPLFDRALSLGETFQPFAPVLYFRAWCLYYLGRVEEAEAAFRAHLEREPEEADSRFGLGVVALDSGRLEEAEAELAEALRLSEAKLARGDARARPDVAKARARLADVHLLRDELEAARAELEAAVSVYPPHYTTWYKLHQVLLRLGDGERAAEALRLHDEWKAKVRPGSEGLGG